MGTTLETGDEQKNNYRIAECNTIFVDEGVRYRHPRGMPPPEFDSDHEFDRDTPSFPIISGSGPSTRAPNSINTGRSVGRALGGPKDPQRRSRVAGLQSSLSQPPSFDTVKGKNVPNAGSRLFSRIKAHDQVGDILHETRHAESNRGGPPPAYSPGVRGSGKGKVTVARSDKVMNRGYRYDDDDD